jgi:hypothetical protein
MPRLSSRGRGAGYGFGYGVDSAGVIDDLLPGTAAGTRGGEGGGGGDSDEGDGGKGDTEGDADTGVGGSDSSGSTAGSAWPDDPAVDEDPAPLVERREALYAVTGHTVWLGGISCDETRILCDGANNIGIMYDFSDHPDADGEGDV